MTAKQNPYNFFKEFILTISVIFILAIIAALFDKFIMKKDQGRLLEVKPGQCVKIASKGIYIKYTGTKLIIDLGNGLYKE